MPCAAARSTAFVLAFLAVASCAPAPDRPDIVLVVVDTLRADHMSTYGYVRDTTPELTAFATANVLFEDARSQASCTFPSANSLLTSRYPAAFLGQPDGAMGIPDDIPSLASMLADAGYRTVAVSGSPIVREHPSPHNPHGGFAKGFETFDEFCQWREAECVNRRAMAALAAAGRPLFLYLHYMDPHDPYNPPAAYERRYATRQGAPDFIARGDPNPIDAMLNAGGPGLELTDAEIGHLRDLYDDEIRSFDGVFSGMLAALASRLGERTIVVVASDHGEEFLEHGQIKHCRNVFETGVRTPLIMKLPGVAGPRRVAAPVQNLDIVPTILDYAGITVALDRLDGRSLRAAIEGDAAAVTNALDAAPAYAYSAQGAARSIAGERYKLILDLTDARYRLFDLDEDPGETVDVALQRPLVLSRMSRDLLALLEVAETRRNRDDILRLEAATQERLRALGYIR